MKRKVLQNEDISLGNSAITKKKDRWTSWRVHCREETRRRIPRMCYESCNCPGTYLSQMSYLNRLRFLSQMMMGSSSSLPLFIVPHTAPPTPPKCCAGNSSQVSKTPPTLRSAAFKKPGVDCKPPQKCFLKIFCRGQGEKMRWSS